MSQVKGKRVAVAGITFESNSFSPGLSELDAFERYLIAEEKKFYMQGLAKMKLRERQ